MDNYTVILEGSAQKDIRELTGYIAEELSEPETARLMLELIKEKILSLSVMPRRNKLINEEPYHSRGIRRIFIKSYVAFYFVDEEKRSVHIVRILYGRREWEHFL